MSSSVGVAIFIAADIAITVIVLSMLGKIPVRRILAWAKQRWV